MLDSSDALASTFVGTPYYMSPELFKGRPYNYKTGKVSVLLFVGTLPLSVTCMHRLINL